MAGTTTWLRTSSALDWTRTITVPRLSVLSARRTRRSSRDS
jgi:hypothetical protein